MESILKPLIKEGKQRTFIPIDNNFDKTPIDNIKIMTKQSEEPGIIMILLKLCTEVCPDPDNGGKSRRRSRKNKRTRKSKKKARRSKKARKTRK